MKSDFTSRLKYGASALAIAATLPFGIQASYAADDAAAAEDEVSFEEVVVTGSRIKRKDLTAISPVAVVPASEFKFSGTINVEQVLNALPQTVPGLTGNSNNPGNGTATVDLRGLGATRTLVLVNGKRYMQSSQANTVDLNTIPSALIKQVEVLTGGASAVYGSDALAGVVNFVLIDDFEGVELNSQYGTSSKGDATKWNVDATIGGNFADGRGNVVLHTSFARRDATFASARDFSFFALGDNDVLPNTQDPNFGDSTPCGGASNCVPGFTRSGSSGIPGTRLFGGPVFDSNNDGVICLSDQQPGCTTATLDTGRIGRFNKDGSAQLWDNVNDRFNYAPDNFIQLPQDRWLINAQGHYDINDHVTFYTRATFTNNRSDIELAPTPAFLGGVEVDANNPFFAQNVQDAFGITDRFSTGSASVAGQDIDGNDIQTRQQVVVARYQAGDTIPAGSAIGDVSSVTDVFDATGNPIEASLGMVDDGNGNMVPGYSVDQLLGSSLNDSDGRVSLPFIGRRMVENGSRQGINSRNGFQVMAGFKGDIDDNWSYDTYYSYSRVDRTELLNNDVSDSRFRQAVDAKLDSNGNIVCNDPSGGCSPLNVFGEGNISKGAIAFVNVGAANVTSITQQVLAANVTGTLGDLGAGDIGLSVGAEYRKDSSEFRPDEFLSSGDILGFNAGKPTVGSFDVYELYGEVYVPLLTDAAFAKSLNFTGAARYSDYSTAGTVWSYSAGLDWTPVEGFKLRGQYQRAVRAPNVAELFLGTANGFPRADDPCSADHVGDNGGIAALTSICEATGVPAGQTGLFDQSNTQIEGAFGGNPNLTEESSDTYTIGAVINPDFLEGFSMTIDYYNINISDVVGTLGGGVNNILKNCYADKDPNAPFCQAVSRRPDGNVDTVSALNANNAVLKTDGIDVQLNYSIDLDSGLFDNASTISMFWLGTYVINNDFLPNKLPGTPFLRCAGTFAGVCGTPDPKYRSTSRLSYQSGPLTTSIKWTYLGGTNQGDIRNGGTDPATLSVARLKAKNYFDLTANYDISESYSVYGGINNLFNNKPQFVGSDQQQGNTFPNVYDVIGTYFYFGARAKF